MSAQAAQTVSKDRSFHPVRKYLESHRLGWRQPIRYLAAERIEFGQLGRSGPYQSVYEPDHRSVPTTFRQTFDRIAAPMRFRRQCEPFQLPA